ncbi:hypothetical protein CEXT_85331 [Caerostris extrusa]|uniref:Uncharacterized protein n=1 Tax=Caerostris extrusa TaxID=172846 RepID=A0AAV4XDZ8_CAEEX|nr:hypothetical protein CEXT_85331 [Caerostris extrusa]
MKEAQIADCVSIAKHIELETTTQEMKPSQDGRPSKIQNGNSPPTYIIKSDISEIVGSPRFCKNLKPKRRTVCPGDGRKLPRRLFREHAGEEISSISVNTAHRDSQLAT